MVGKWAIVIHSNGVNFLLLCPSQGNKIITVLQTEPNQNALNRVHVCMFIGLCISSNRAFRDHIGHTCVCVCIILTVNTCILSIRLSLSLSLLSLCMYIPLNLFFHFRSDLSAAVAFEICVLSKIVSRLDVFTRILIT